MVVIDATMLLLLLRSDAGVPKDDSTGAPVTNFKQRLEYWVECTEKAGEKIIIPTPALSEALVRAGPAGPQYVAEISRQSVFQIVPFDVLEAIEVAEMTRTDPGKKQKKDEAQTLAKIKYDRQIVAIAKVAGAKRIYTDDKGIRGLAGRMKIDVVRLAELPERPLPPQQELDFNPEQDGPVVEVVEPLAGKDAKEEPSAT